MLVHCWQGISRSATFVIAYLMKENGTDEIAAAEIVRSKRWYINPNANFVK